MEGNAGIGWFPMSVLALVLDQLPQCWILFARVGIIG